MSIALPRLSVLLPSLALCFGAHVAAAAVCTVAPTTTLSLAPRPAAPPGFPAGFTQNNSVTATYAINATATGEGSCDNLSRGFGARLLVAGLPDDGNPASAGETENDSNTWDFTDVATGTYKARVMASCGCGLLGRSSGGLDTGTIVVPPTIQTTPVADSDDHSNGSDITFNTIPKGALAHVFASIEGSLCTGETMKVTLTGPGGINVVQTAEGNASCTGAFGLKDLQFTPTEVGALSLVAEYKGVQSNIVTGAVIAGKTTTDPGTTPDPTDTSSKSGCHAVDATAFTLAGAVLAGLLRRRR